jgi:hypothetical protein
MHPFPIATERPAQPLRASLKHAFCMPWEAKPCKRGHASGRGAENRCLECDRGRKNKDYKDDKERRKAKCREYREINREEIIRRAAARRAAKPEFFMLKSAKKRAREGNYVCTITVADIIIPDFCPLLGIKLERGTGKLNPSSPSLDRILPHLGYIPGNVWVISHRANSIKHDATLEELQTITSNLTKTMHRPPWER